jgi:hypothetical protein
VTFSPAAEFPHPLVSPEHVRGPSHLTDSHGGILRGAVSQSIIQVRERRGKKQQKEQKEISDCTYRTITSGIQYVDPTFGREGLRARDNALAAVDDAPPARELEELGGSGGEDGRRGERHGGEGSGEGGETS